VYTLGEPGVRAWDLEEPFNPKTINVRAYITLLNRAMGTIMQPFDLEEEQQPLPSFFHSLKSVA
jgi:hypothetical protein